jgi:predicted GNAT superfamily acetyltransferase
LRIVNDRHTILVRTVKPLLVRDILPTDLDAIHAINEAGSPGVYRESLARLAAITREACIALVAEIDGVVAGFCQVLPPGADYGSLNYAWFSSRYDDFVYLDRVAVAPPIVARASATVSTTRSSVGRTPRGSPSR